MNNYNFQEACKTLIDFFEVLNNWYIRHSCERFWKSELDQDKTDAYNVLYKVFYYILRAANHLNLLKPTVHMMHHQFNIQQLYAPPTLYLCVLYLSENKQRLVPRTA